MVHQKQEVCNYGIHLNYKILISVANLLEAETAQQGKQMRVGARKGFACNSVRLVLLPTGNPGIRLIPKQSF
jgi:hypothetical protein